MGIPASQRTVQKLVEEHYVSLYRYAFRLSGTAADAEDLTQDTFCQAQLKLSQLRDPGCTRAWLFRILRNAYLHRIRSENHEQLVSLNEVEELAERLPGSLPPVEPEQLQQALNELPEPFRTPIILYYFEDFSYRDIAAQMDLPLGTVMSRLARAKAILRMRLLAPALLAPGSGRATDGL
jgi:RNA polymerase sigma-70 factor (ECF subfamily)